MISRSLNIGVKDWLEKSEHERGMYHGHFRRHPPTGDIHTQYLLAQLLELLAGSYFFKQTKLPEDTPPQKPNPLRVEYTDFAPWLKETALDVRRPWTEDDEEKLHISRALAMLGERK